MVLLRTCPQICTLYMQPPPEDGQTGDLGFFTHCVFLALSIRTLGSHHTAGRVEFDGEMIHPQTL